MFRQEFPQFHAFKKQSTILQKLVEVVKTVIVLLTAVLPKKLMPTFFSCFTDISFNHSCRSEQNLRRVAWKIAVFSQNLLKSHFVVLHS